MDRRNDVAASGSSEPSAAAAAAAAATTTAAAATAAAAAAEDIYDTVYNDEAAPEEHIYDVFDDYAAQTSAAHGSAVWRNYVPMKSCEVGAVYEEICDSGRKEGAYLLPDDSDEWSDEYEFAGDSGFTGCGDGGADYCLSV